MGQETSHDARCVMGTKGTAILRSCDMVRTLRYCTVSCIHAYPDRERLPSAQVRQRRMTW